MSVAPSYIYLDKKGKVIQKNKVRDVQNTCKWFFDTPVKRTNRGNAQM